MPKYISRFTNRTKSFLTRIKPSLLELKDWWEILDTFIIIVSYFIDYYHLFSGKFPWARPAYVVIKKIFGFIITLVTGWLMRYDK